MAQPNYQNGSIVNLMSSLQLGLGGLATGYPPLTLLPPETIADSTNVVLLIIDGLGYNYLQSHGGALSETLQGRITSLFPTSTAPAVTTFMTGVAPQQHGVTGWFMQLKELGTVAMILPFQSRWGGDPFASAGIGPSDLIPYPSVFDSLNAGCYIVIHHQLVDSPYSVAGAGRAERVGYQNLADCFAVVERIVSKGTRRKYVYVYWPLFDSLSHQYGVGSAPVAAHYREINREFSSCLQALSGTDTLLIATADHGFVDTTPGVRISLEDHPELADCLALPLCGEPRAAYCYVRPGKTERFERYVTKHLKEYCDLYPSEELVRRGWFGLGEPSPRLLERIGDYVLVTKDRYVIKDSLLSEGEWAQVGVHGGISDDEMFVPLIVARC